MGRQTSSSIHGEFASHLMQGVLNGAYSVKSVPVRTCERADACHNFRGVDGLR